MARTFNGSASNYLHAVGLKYDFPTNASVVFRAKTSVDGGMIVMGRRNLIAGAGFAISRDPDFNALVFSAYGDGDKFKFASFDKWPADGNYHSFILTNTGTSWTLYIDVATAIATETASPAATPDPDLFIGALNDLASGGAVAPFNGSIDDVAFFSVALDSTDRAAFLGGAAPSTLGAAASGQHYWTMDNAAATGETDDFGSADLTEVGTVGYEDTGGGGSGSVVGSGLLQSLLTQSRLRRGLVR